jgi:pyruvate/2-oxoglutarate dehydrogenase complex dihydrolipoamide acyltransferase (E2) component
MSFDVIARTLLTTTVGLILVCGCAPRAGSGNNPATNAAAPSTAATQHPAIRAYIDPATGQLRDPTPEELAAEAADQAAREKATDANSPAKQKQQREVVLPDGTIEITLDKSTQQPLRGCVQQNGDIKMDHKCEPQGSKAKIKSDEQ